MRKSRHLTAWMLLLALVGVAIPLGLGNKSWADDDDSPLAKQMKQINEGYKELRKEARVKKFSPDTGKVLADMELHTLNSMHLDVPKLQKMSASQRKEQLVEFKKQLKGQLDTLIDMEIAFEQGDMAAVAKGVDDLGSMKKKGHNQFQED